jgi:lipopolysaccharide exporter
MNIFSSGKLKSGLYSIGSRISFLIFGFGGFYFLVRTQSKEDFGAWSLFLTITTILEMSRTGLIQNALIKLYHANEKSDQSKVISACWIINALFTLIVYLILVGLAFFSDRIFGLPDLKFMFLLYGLTLVLLVPLTQFNYIQQAHFSFTGIFWSSFVRQGLLFLFILFAFIFDHTVSLAELVVWQTIGTGGALLAAYITAKPFLIYRYVWDKVVTVKVLHFGKYVMGTNLFSLLFKSSDQFSIGVLMNPASVATYSSAIRMSNIIEYPATAIAEVMYPHSSARISAEGDQVIKSMYEKSVGLTLAIIVPAVVFVFVFSEWIIHVAAGPAYAEAADILRITILFGLLTPFNRQFGMAMDSSGRPHFNFYLLVIAAIINVGLNLIFVQFLGVMGAAYATLISYLIISTIGHFFLVKLFSVEVKKVMVYMFMAYAQGWGLLKSFAGK